MEISELQDRGIKIEWTFKEINKTRRQQNRQGRIVAAHAATITIPYSLAKIISEDETYFYIYEHFEKTVITPHEPPKEYSFKKIRLNNSSRNEISNKRFELPNVFLDTDTTEYATISYYPNRLDYISNKRGLFLVDTHGYNPRKHIKREVNLKNKTISYDVYVKQSNAPEGICFHQDIKNIIPNEIYIYIYDGEICMTNTQPQVECIETSEEELIDDLYRQKLIDNKTDKIKYVLYLDENDVFNRKVPKIILKPQ